MASIRSYIRLALSAGLTYTGINRAALAKRALEECALVLCYHRVLDRDCPQFARTEPALVTSTEVFVQQMEMIARRFNPVSLSDLINWMNGDFALPGRAVLVTFDDGWQDTYTSAFPIMRSLTIPGVVFLSTGFIDTSEQYWTDKVYASLYSKIGADAAHAEVDRIKRIPPDKRQAILDSIEPLHNFGSNLTWEHVSEMASQGFEFGSHTRSHVILPQQLGAHALRELVSSADDIEQQLGVRPVTIAYPDGQYDEATCRMASVAHYKCAFTCEEGLCTLRSMPYALPRLNIHDGVCVRPDGKFSPSMFLTYLCGTIPWRHTRRLK